MANEERQNEIIIARLERLPQIIKAPTADALHEQAQALVATMRAAAPFKSGRLRDSIRIEPGKHPLQVVIRAGGPLTTKYYERTTSGSDVNIGQGKGGGGGSG